VRRGYLHAHVELRPAEERLRICTILGGHAPGAGRYGADRRSRPAVERGARSAARLSPQRPSEYLALFGWLVVGGAANACKMSKVWEIGFQRRATTNHGFSVGYRRPTPERVCSRCGRALFEDAPSGSSIAASTGGKPEAWRAFGIISCRQKPSHRASAQPHRPRLRRPGPRARPPRASLLCNPRARRHA
jgi:hypothetical protein